LCSLGVRKGAICAPYGNGCVPWQNKFIIFSIQRASICLSGSIFDKYFNILEYQKMLNFITIIIVAQ
jgi:hypothetical protein